MLDNRLEGEVCIAVSSYRLLYSVGVLCFAQLTLCVYITYSSTRKKKTVCILVALNDNVSRVPRVCTFIWVLFMMSWKASSYSMYLTFRPLTDLSIYPDCYNTKASLWTVSKYIQKSIALPLVKPLWYIAPLFIVHSFLWMCITYLRPTFRCS